MSNIIQPDDPMVQQAMQAEQQARMQQAAIQQMAESIRLQMTVFLFTTELVKYDADMVDDEVRTKIQRNVKTQVENNYPALMELLGFKEVKE